MEEIKDGHIIQGPGSSTLRQSGQVGLSDEASGRSPEREEASAVGELEKDSSRL